ncbi:MAG TPA: hypothetical protein VFU94_02840, partial [Conexibacter sp.]|nr:hypothetical protein [Conexibacter sp.]
TLPPATLDAQLDAEPASVVGAGEPDDHVRVLRGLEAAGVALGACTAELQRIGVELFRRAYLDLLEDVAARLRSAPAGRDGSAA